MCGININYLVSHLSDCATHVMSNFLDNNSDPPISVLLIREADACNI